VVCVKYISVNILHKGDEDIDNDDGDDDGDSRGGGGDDDDEYGDDGGGGDDDDDDGDDMSQTRKHIFPRFIRFAH
jgi:hypothetical protein